MWISIARGGGFGLVVVTFVMWLARVILDELIPFATSGPNADHATVQQGATLFSVLSQDNLILIGMFGVGIYLIGRAASERRVRA